MKTPTKNVFFENWRDNEIRRSLSVRADAEIVGKIQGTARELGCL